MWLASLRGMGYAGGAGPGSTSGLKALCERRTVGDGPPATFEGTMSQPETKPPSGDTGSKTRIQGTFVATNPNPDVTLTASVAAVEAAIEAYKAAAEAGDPEAVATLKALQASMEQYPRQELRAMPLPPGPGSDPDLVARVQRLEATVRELQSAVARLAHGPRVAK